MTRILVVTADAVGPRLAGPAIRASAMAQVLADHGHDVRLATTGPVAGTSPFPIAAEAVDGDRLLELAGWAEATVFQGWVLADHPELARAGCVLVADVYDPMHLEQLEQGRDAGARGHVDAVADCTVVLNHQLLRADFLLCASERQRDFWLGHLASLGRINPATYDDDPTLRRLIDVAPFGLAGAPPSRVEGPSAPLILWGGGLYNWFDPITLLHAVDQLRRQVPDVRLEFLGGTHPSPTIPTMRIAAEAREVAARLDLLDGCVTFREGWVPYAERGAVLAGAAVGVSTHRHHIETDFAFRTRLLDYLWARIPIVTTSGDTLAELVAEEDLGLVVPPGDVDALATALATALTDTTARARWRSNADRVAPRYEWSRTLAPLVAFCEAPRRAPDLIDAEVVHRLAPGARPTPRRGWRASVHVARDVVRRDGLRGFAARMAGRLRRGRGNARSGGSAGSRQNSPIRP